MFNNKSLSTICKIITKPSFNYSKNSLLYSGNRFYSTNNKNNTYENKHENKNNKNESKFGKYKYTVGAGLVGGIALVMSSNVFLDDQKKEPTWREQIITNYQNRIREYSTPEKIFQCFASVKQNGESFMTVEDFIRAILPHQFQASSNTSTKSKTLKIKEIPLSFKIADIDGDGLISYGEFLFFSTLLSIPQNSAAIAFKIMDINQDNSIDAQEFMGILKILQNQSQFAKNTSSTTPQTDAVAKGWIEHLFGKSGNKKLSLEQFQQLLDQVRRDVLLLEFRFYDPKNTGFISQRDFGLLLISYGKAGKLESHVKSLDSLPAIVSEKHKGISFDQFAQFNKLLDKLPDVALAMDLYGDMNQPFSKKQFKYIANIVCGFNPEQQVLDTLYKVFDTDNNGSLEKGEFVNILSRRKYRGLQTSRDTGIFSKLKRVYNILTGQE
ncbi:hypothetical protein DLAC_03090 [Tieghemostelium lacteum]|uniref:EF-hand domain-containing protein n=1 Tax=Tieghemostelium lacteum TaxID=361077 RepID=A0A152A2K4_TIELA|nr:hypothetical protein DLAC_03090 [Tieghemostelium lacteum]|eukprot:KYR00347.1 hypothetical protein DLAC_03090 [Tieghemostelium lacteum]